MFFKSEKTIVILLIITLSVLTFSRLQDNNKRNSLAVFNDIDNNIEENSYIVDLSNSSFTTKNIYLFKSDIYEIYPKIDEKYNSLVNAEWFIIDKTINYEQNISNLEKKYIQEFKNNALNTAALDIEYNGLKIDKLKISTTDISKYKNYKYQQLNFE